GSHIACLTDNMVLGHLAQQLAIAGKERSRQWPTHHIRQHRAHHAVNQHLFRIDSYPALQRAPDGHSLAQYQRLAQRIACFPMQVDSPAANLCLPVNVVDSDAPISPAHQQLGCRIKDAFSSFLLLRIRALHIFFLCHTLVYPYSEAMNKFEKCSYLISSEYS